MSEAYKGYRRPDDLGTPAIESDASITLTVDGKAISVPEGTTVIRAAALANVVTIIACHKQGGQRFLHRFIVRIAVGQ